MTTSLDLDVAGVSDTGRRRKHNEDVILWRTQGVQEGAIAVLLVADGMGGAAAGEVASRAAADKCSELLADGDFQDVHQTLRNCIQAAAGHVYELSQQNASYEGMGTTVSLALVRANELFVGHVGDSRCYLIRRGAASQVTSDHTWVADEVQSGRLTKEEAKVHPNRHVISRSVGIDPTVAVDTYGPIALQPGDVILLCSDGLSDVVNDEEMAAVASRHPPQEAARELVALANKRGGPDNISVVLARVPGGDGVAAAVEDQQTAEITVRLSGHRPRRRRSVLALAAVGIGGPLIIAGVVFAFVAGGGGASGGGDAGQPTGTQAAVIPNSPTVSAHTTASSSPGASSPTPGGSPGEQQDGTVVGSADCGGKPAVRYRTKDRDTFSALSGRYNVSEDDLRACNQGVTDTGIPHPGELIIPCPDGDCSHLLGAPADQGQSGQRTGDTARPLSPTPDISTTASTPVSKPISPIVP